MMLKTGVRIALGLAIAFFFPVLGALAATPGPKNGFRDLHWGDKPTDAMVKFTTKANMDVYYLRNDPDRVAGMDKATIHYLFFRERFCRAEVFWRKLLNDAERKALIAVLEREWGPPDEISIIDSRTWVSPDGKTRAYLMGHDDVRTPEVDYFMNLIVENIACSKEATSGAGL